MSIATYNLPDFVVGNTWPGVPLYTVTKPSGAGDLDEVEIQFRTDAVSNPKYVAKISVSGGEITIVPSTDGFWRFTIPAQVLPIEREGTYFQSIKLIDDSTPAKPYTYTQGTIKGTLPVTR